MIKIDRQVGGQIYRFYESTTGQTVHVVAPVYFHDNFHRSEILVSESGSDGIWSERDVSAVGATTPIITPNAKGARILLDATDEAQDSALHFADQRPFDAGANLQMELALVITSASMTGIRMIAGVANDIDDDKDAVAVAAWFSMSGDLVLDVETDDTTNNTNATGDTTWVTTERHYVRIDMRALADVQFFVDGARYESGTTFDMSNMTAAEQQMQPYCSLDKASGTTLCLMDIEDVKVWST